MKVSISCPGRFHSFNLAYQMERLGLLQQLITSYPSFEIVNYGIPQSKTSTLVYWELLNRSWARISRITRTNRVLLQYQLCQLYDKKAANLIDSRSNVFIGWSSSSELGFKKAKQLDALTIVERGSTHIEVQTELLNEEYSQYHHRRKPLFTHPSVIEKELREYQLADFISVPSSFVKNSFISKGIPPEKIFCNPYGVDLTMFRPATKMDSVFRVVYVGQMSLQKGVHYLLEAFNALKLKNAELQLIGARTEEIKPYFEKYEGSFSFLGPKPQSELNHYYTQSSVFVLCSIQEGLAMVIAQAMASGLPVICTTNTGAEDLISNGKEGFVIPIRDIESIKEKIVWMYENPEHALNMGAAAREKVINGFSWDDYGNRYHAFLKSKVHG